MPTQLVATMAYPYAGRSLAIGDTFDASDRDAKTLILVGRARLSLSPSLIEAAPTQLPVPVVSDEPTDTEAVRPRRAYRRRVGASESE